MSIHFYGFKNDILQSFTARTHIGIQFVAMAVNSMLEFLRLTYLVDRQHRLALCLLVSHLWSIERSRSWKDLLWVVLRAYSKSFFNLILIMVRLPPTTSFPLSLDPSLSHPLHHIGGCFVSLQELALEPSPLPWLCLHACIAVGLLLGIHRVSAPWHTPLDVFYHLVYTVFLPLGIHSFDVSCHLVCTGFCHLAHNPFS